MPQPLHSQSKKMIEALIDYFTKERDNGGPLIPVAAVQEMADVAIDPQNSNSKELFGQGVRAYVLQDYDTAVRAFSKSSELLAEEHGNDTHDSLGDVYLYYGKALLELSRKESGPLGDGVLKNVEEGSESEEIEASDGEEDKETENETKTEEEANGETNKTDDEKTKETKPVGNSTKADDTEKSKPAADSAKSDDKTSESSQEEASSSVENTEIKETEEGDNDEASGSSQQKEGGETEEELTDLQVAWEVLELAKRIFVNRGTEGKKNLAETLIVLGEISLESGNFSSAIEDMVEGLEIQKTLFGSDSRTIAETYYKLGGAYSTNAQIDEAIESFYASYEYLQNKVSSLKKEEEHKEANEEEIEELNNLIPEIQEKIADMKNLKAEVAKKAISSVDSDVSKTNGAAEASSSKQVNNISHLVKRKRREDEAQDENPSKRPSP